MKEFDDPNNPDMARGPTAATTAAPPGVDPVPRARRGEKVSVWVDVIKADKREAWERLLHEVVAPAAREVDPDVLARTRLLEPAAANQDGNWTFVIMPDPLEERFDYDATRYVRETLGPEKAEEFDRAWDDCHAEPQYEIALIESAW